MNKPLPEKTVSKMVVADSAIKKIDQPFTSFGGKVKESSNDFYTRVSERPAAQKTVRLPFGITKGLFYRISPRVYKLKCLNHTRFEGTYTSINEASPRHVSLIVVSNVRNKNAVDPLKPAHQFGDALRYR